MRLAMHFFRFNNDASLRNYSCWAHSLIDARESYAQAAGFDTFYDFCRQYPSGTISVTSYEETYEYIDNLMQFYADDTVPADTLNNLEKIGLIQNGTITDIGQTIIKDVTESKKLDVLLSKMDSRTKRLPKNWLRIERAKQLRAEGKTFRAIGEDLAVSASRARQLAYTRYPKSQATPHWSHGLPTYAFNQLLQSEIASREDCQRVFIDNPQNVSMRYNDVIIKINDDVTRFTLKTFNVIRVWLGASPLSARRTNIPQAIKYLEKFGYTVIAPQKQAYGQ